MRKKKRIPRPISTILSPAEVDELVIAPRIHLALLLEGKAELIHLQSLVGILNLGMCIASVRNNAMLSNEVGAGMSILELVIRAKPPALPNEQVDTFLAIFSKIESVIRMTTRTTLIAAFDLLKEAEQSDGVEAT